MKESINNMKFDQLSTNITSLTLFSPPEKPKLVISTNKKMKEEEKEVGGATYKEIIINFLGCD